jgi:hypothetical protein
LFGREEGADVEGGIVINGASEPESKLDVCQVCAKPARRLSLRRSITKIVVVHQDVEALQIRHLIGIHQKSRRGDSNPGPLHYE